MSPLVDARQFCCAQILWTKEARLSFPRGASTDPANHVRRAHENERRGPGTENVASHRGMAAAAECNIARRETERDTQSRIARSIVASIGRFFLMRSKMATLFVGLLTH